MTNRLFRENQRAWQNSQPEYFGLRYGVTGKSDGAGNFDPNASVDLPDGQTWVLLDGDRDSSACLNLRVNPYSPGVDVKTEISRYSGRREITGVFQREGSSTSATILRQAAVPVPLQFDSTNIAIGLVQPATDRGGTWIYVRAFNHDGGAFLSGERQYYDLSTEIAALSSGASALAIVGVDTAANTVSVTVGTENSLIYAYAPEDADAVSTAAGIVRLAALVLKDGQTLAAQCFGQNPPRYFDQRQFLNLAGGSGSGFPDYGTADTIQIASGVLDISAATSRNIIVQAESGTADTVTEVVGLDDGEAAVFRADAGDTITFEDNADILLYNGVDVDVVSTDLLELVGRGAGVVGQPVDQNDGGTSLGTLVYSKWDVDAPPASPHASDDEFEGAVSGSWTTFDHGSTATIAASSMGKGVKMTLPQTATKIAGLLRGAPAGDFTMVTRLHMISETPATRIAGLILAEGTANNSPFYVFLLSGNTLNNNQNVQLHYYTDYDSFASSDFATNPTTAVWGKSLAIYLRVRRISTTYHLDYSFDGISWAKAGTSTLPNITSLAYIGIGGASNSNTLGTMYLVYDFFRVHTDTAFDSPVSGQVVGIYAPP